MDKRLMYKLEWWLLFGGSSTLHEERRYDTNQGWIAIASAGPIDKFHRLPEDRTWNSYSFAESRHDLPGQPCIPKGKVIEARRFETYEPAKADHIHPIFGSDWHYEPAISTIWF